MTVVSVDERFVLIGEPFKTPKVIIPANEAAHKTPAIMPNTLRRLVKSVFSYGATYVGFSSKAMFGTFDSSILNKL